jgi:hypothetical protein
MSRIVEEASKVSAPKCENSGFGAEVSIVGAPLTLEIFQLFHAENAGFGHFGGFLSNWHENS